MTAGNEQGRSAALLDRARRVIPGGINSVRRQTPFPISIRRAQGAYVWDVDGRRYLDFHAAYSPVVLGHSHAAVTLGAAEAASNLVLVGIGTTEPEVTLAERLVEHIPSAEQVLFVSSGSEATSYAVRLARAATGRDCIVKFAGHYHGSHDYLLGPEETEASAGVLPAAADKLITCRYNDIDGLQSAFAARGPEIAAVIVEPIAHNPNLLPEPGFLEGVREITEHHGCLLIFDEIITGFRHGLGGYQAICNVKPDLTTVGKAIANGFQLAAIGGPERLMRRFATHPGGNVWFAGTYNGNGVSVAAANATISVMETEPVHEHIFRLGDRMRAGLRAILLESGTEGVVTGYGSIYTVLFGVSSAPRSYDELAALDADLLVAFRTELIKRSVIEMPVPHVRAQVSYSHTDDDVDLALTAARDALPVARDRVAATRRG